MFNNKKAVSPLIATVLLIAFAVALGAVVMNWGRGYVEDTQDFARERSDAEVTCSSEIDLDVVQIDLVKQVCYNTTTTPWTGQNVTMILENVATRDVETIQVRVISKGSRVPYMADLGNSSSTGLNAGQAKLFTFMHNSSDLGDISQIAVTPTIQLGGKLIKCSGSQLQLLDIRPCSEIWD
ncbi:MAG: archaellin/type IV pilin N-terminal domain-containing protein [Candidatus Nanoarchaeia archaeon]